MLALLIYAISHYAMPLRRCWRDAATLFCDGLLIFADYAAMFIFITPRYAAAASDAAYATLLHAVIIDAIARRYGALRRHILLMFRCALRAAAMMRAALYAMR